MSLLVETSWGMWLCIVLRVFGVPVSGNQLGYVIRDCVLGIHSLDWNGLLEWNSGMTTDPPK